MSQLSKYKSLNEGLSVVVPEQDNWGTAGGAGKDISLCSKILVQMQTETKKNRTSSVRESFYAQT